MRVHANYFATHCGALASLVRAFLNCDQIVVVRVKDSYVLEMHIDTVLASASGTGSMFTPKFGTDA